MLISSAPTYPWKPQTIMTANGSRSLPGSLLPLSTKDPEGVWEEHLHLGHQALQDAGAGAAGWGAVVLGLLKDLCFLRWHGYKLW